MACLPISSSVGRSLFGSLERDVVHGVSVASVQVTQPDAVTESVIDRERDLSRRVIPMELISLIFHIAELDRQTDRVIAARNGFIFL